MVNYEELTTIDDFKIALLNIEQQMNALIKLIKLDRPERRKKGPFKPSDMKARHTEERKTRNGNIKARVKQCKQRQQNRNERH